MRGPTVAALASATALTVVTVLVAVLLLTPDEEPTVPLPGAERSEAGPEPSEPTEPTAYGAADVGLVRGPFCDRVSPTGVERALGGVPADSETWEDGDRERLPDGSRDRVHEYGCRWTATDGTQASAWVFVPPVTLEQGRAIAAEATDGPCLRVDGAPRFGRVGSVVRCVLDTGLTEHEHAGLFGDAWLTCTLSAAGRPRELADRTAAWCVEVVEATRA